MARILNWMAEAVTAWAARKLFLEDRIGTIEAGKNADILYYTMPAADIKNLKREPTILAVRVVYQDAAGLIAFRK